jgi:hypothetical protein
LASKCRFDFTCLVSTSRVAISHLNANTCGDQHWGGHWCWGAHWHGCYQEMA